MTAVMMAELMIVFSGVIIIHFTVFGGYDCFSILVEVVAAVIVVVVLVNLGITATIIAQ
jgi:hypothetical protein